MKFSMESFFFLCCWVIFCAASCLGITLTDSDGQIVNVRQPFSRIISLYGAHTRNLLDLGLSREILAVGRSDHQLKRPHLSTRDDPERFLALRPDLVLIRPMISRSHPRLIRRLRAAGVSVVSLQPASVDRLFWYWETLGKLVGRQQAAREMISRFGRELARVRRAVARIPEQRRQHVYFESIHRRMKTFAPDSMAIFVLESAGGINVAADAPRIRNTNIAAYGKERILAHADEIDVLLAQKGRMNPVTIGEIKNEPGFQVIRAVRRNRIFLVDEKLVSRPTLGLIQGMWQVFGCLYPKRPLDRRQ